MALEGPRRTTSSFVVAPVLAASVRGGVSEVIEAQELLRPTAAAMGSLIRLRSCSDRSADPPRR